MPAPVFIVAAPRSGAVLLTETLGRSAGVVMAPGAIDAAIEASCGGRERLTAADAVAPVTEALRLELMRTTNGGVLLDASPRNPWRVPFLHAVFPRAVFVYIYRDPRRAVHDMSDGRTPITDLASRWNAATAQLLDDLEQIPPESWLIADFRALTQEPAASLARIAGFLHVEWDGCLPPSPLAIDTPPPDTIAGLDLVEELTRDVATRARGLFASPPPRSAPSRERALEMLKEEGAQAFRSIATPSFPRLLSSLGISLAVSTYQSGRLIFVRADAPDTLNTHFRMFRSPMGIAVGPGRLVLGTEREVWDYRNQPAISARLDPPGKHDACFMPRKVHVTGDIRVHEIAFASGQPWIVNTRFSALCTLDGDSSFAPQWHPPFITRLAAEDRCHLNGMAVVDGQVRYASALGTADTPGGWREKKASGGVLLELESGEVVLHGLCMPHSPRLYDGRFFILESGRGTIAAADLRAGRVQTIAELPGFTRGLAFAGPFAFVGLSQVRESNIFGGIPLTERLPEERRECGVYALDLRTGQIVAFLRFEGDVREIFDVQVLHGIRYPELLEITSPLVSTSYSVPDETLAAFT